MLLFAARISCAASMRSQEQLGLQVEDLMSPWVLLQEDYESGINPCTVTEDLTGADWLARFQQQVRGGQRPGVSRQQVIRLGTMGCGKTSAVDLFLQDHFGYSPGMFQNIELDMIVTSAKKYRDAVCEGPTLKALSHSEMDAAYWNVREKELHVASIVSNIEATLLAEGLTFSSETTGKSFCSLRRRSRNAFKQGYEVIGVAPYVPFYLVKQRVVDRAAKEGRTVAMVPLMNSFMTFIPRVMSMTLEVDTFFLIDNTVAFGEVPRVLLESQSDFTKGDPEKCARRTVNLPAVESLLTELEQHSGDYMGDDQVSVFEAERDMLNALIAAAGSADFPACEPF